MSYRRKHRWFRRMALGLAFASVLVAGRASVAAAKVDEGAGRSYYVSAADPYLTDVFVRPGESLGGPDGAGVSQSQAALRPDDRATRFVHPQLVSQPEPSSGRSAIEWDGALTVGIGAFVLVLGLGLAVGYFRRPRLAGL